MSRFIYRAKDKNARYCDGEIEAFDQNEATHRLYEKGLFVIKIVDAEAPAKRPAAAAPAGSKAAPTQPVVERKERLEGSLAKIEVVKYESPAAKLLKDVFSRVGRWVLFGFGGLAILAFLAMFFKPQKASLAGVNYRIVETEDFIDQETVAKTFKVVIDKGVTSVQVRNAAQRIYDEKKKEIPNLAKALCTFYYPDQDVKMESPVAAVSWNWRGDGARESSFDLSVAGAAKDNLTVKQGALRRGRSIHFDFIVYNKVSLDGAQQMSRERLEKLKGEWEKKVSSIDVDVFYDGFDNPFMQCQWDKAGASVVCTVLEKK